MKPAAGALLVLLLTAFAVPAFAEVRISVIDVDPGYSARLGHWEHFSLRIYYQTDRPIRIFGDAYLGDKKVTSINGGSPLYDAPHGEALFWFAYTDPARVDRIVLRAVDERTNEVLAEAERPVSLEWTGRRTEKRTPAPWVTRLLDEQSRRARARAAENTGSESAGDTVLGLVMFLGVPVYFILQPLALWRMRGGWRIAAAVPAVPMGLVLAWTILAMLAGSNLFPLMLIFASPPAAVYLFLLLAAYGLAPAR